MSDKVQQTAIHIDRVVENLDKDKLYYFASPYSHKQGLIRDLRYEITIYFASELINKGFTLFEPIAMCHEKSYRHDLPTGYKFWQTRDREFIDRCDATLVLNMHGVKTSVGVQDEIQYTLDQGKEVIYLNVDLENIKTELFGEEDAIY